VLAAVVLVSFYGCVRLPEGRYAIDRVYIEGASDHRDTELEQRIATAPSPRFLGLWEGVVFDYELFDRYVLERDLQRVERFYRARGYYEAHARAGRVERTKEGHVRVTIVVEEGLPVKVGEVRPDGIAMLPLDDSAAALAAIRGKLRHDEPFDEDDFEAAEQEMQRALMDQGYAFATVKGSAKVDLPRRVANVTLAVSAGPKSRLGPIDIKGLGDLPEGPVRRALDLKEGDPYSASQLEAARRAALALGVFASVEIEPVLKDPTSDVVPINVLTVPSKLRGVKLGGGIELDVIRTDVHGMTGWEDRNFLGGLRKLSIDLKPGLVFYPTRLSEFKWPTNLLPENRAHMELRQPGFLEARTAGILRGAFDIYPVPASPQSGSTPGSQTVILGYRQVQAGAGVDRTFGRLFTSLFYNFQLSKPFDYASNGPELNAQKVVLSYLDLTTTLDFRDDVIHPHKGIFLRNSLQYAGGPLQGDATDVRVQPEVRGFIPVARRWTLAARATTGFLFAKYGATLVDQTPDERDIQLVYFRGFFSGGPNSNRGYPYAGVGPRGSIPFLNPAIFQLQQQNRCAAGSTEPECAFPYGGLSLWEASLELRFPMWGPLTGTVFGDTSDVARSLVIRLDHPHLALGLGLHYDTPVGPLRFDLGIRVPGLQVPADELVDRPVAPYWGAVSIGIGEAF
jgi:outer membrane protein assembly factor BamA